MRLKTFVTGLGILLAILVGIAGALAQTYTYPMASDLRYYYTFDDNKTSGTASYDSTDTLNGTLTNGVTSGQTGKIGQSYDFNAGDSEYVVLDSSSIPDFKAMDNFSVSVWFYPDTVGENNQWFIGRDQESNRQFVFGLAMNKLSGYINGGGAYTFVSNSTFSASQWIHGVFTRQGSMMRIYLNGNLDGALNGYSTINTSNQPTSIGRRAFSTSQKFFDGKLDEIAIFNKTLNATEVAELYNSGSGLDYSLLTSQTGILSNFSVTAKDLEGNSINNFTAVINGSSYSTTSGTVISEIIQDSGSVTVTIQDAIDNNGYFFNKTATGIDTASNYEMEDLYQIEFIVNTRELWTNNTIQSPLIINSSTLTINGDNDTTVTYRLLSGLYTIKAYNDSYYNLTTANDFTALYNDTFYFDGLYNVLVSVTARNGFTNASINTFSGYADHLNYSQYQTYNTSTGTANIPGLPGTFRLFAIAPGFATEAEYNWFNLTVPSGQTTGTHTFYLYTNNSIEFHLYDADTFAVINESVNISMIAPNKTYSYSTSNGTLFVDGIFDGTYTTTFTSTNYNPSQIFITVTNNSYQLQNVYLESGDTNTVTFYVKNNLGAAIENATATLVTDVNGTDVVVAQETTDFAGIFQVALNPDKWYQITLTHQNYETWTGSVKPTQSTYTINMDNLGSTRFESIYEDLKYFTSMNHPINSTYAEFSLTLVSSLGSLQFYGLQYNSTLLTNQTGSVGGGTETINVTNITNPDAVITITYWFKSTNSTYTEWTKQWRLSDYTNTNTSLAGGLFDSTSDADQGLQVFLAMGLILFLIIGGGLLTSSLIGASLAGMIGTGVSAFAGWLPLPVTIVALVILITMLVSDAIAGGGG